MTRAAGKAGRSGRARATGTALGAALALALGLLAPGVAVAADDGPGATATPSAEATPTEDAPVTADDTVTDDPDSEKPAEPDVPPPPVPATPEGLPTAVDALANYQGQGICDPSAKKGTQAFADLIKATYGSLAYSIGIPRDCSIGGQSEHKEGRALDWMINRRVKLERKTAEAFIDWLLATDENGNEFAMARRLGVMYIGWDDQIWGSYRQGWSELHGCYSRPDPSQDNDCHRNHIHISLSWDGAAGQTSFWGGTPTPAPFCNRWASASSEPMPVGNGLDFVAITPRRVLDSRQGLGLPNGQACRLTQNSGGGAGAPVSLDVAELPRVPAEGVRAVAVRTVTVGSNSPATLRARTFDGASIAPIKMNARTEATTVVPVGADGTIAFTTDSGATHLLVDVIGYFVKPAAAVGVGGRLSLQDQQVVYDTADDTVLGPKEKRIISVATDDTLPTGALLSITISDAGRSGKLVVREAGSKRTSATPVLSYRQSDVSTQTVLTGVDEDGNIVVVNKGRESISLRVAVQATAQPSATEGSLLIPVAPTEITGKRTAMRRVLRDAQGSTAVLVQVDARTPKKAATLTYWSGTLTPTTLAIGRRTTQSSLIVVPLSESGLILREVVGGDVDVTARIVGYLR